MEEKQNIEGQSPGNTEKSSPLLITLVLINTIFVGYLLYQQTRLTDITNNVISDKTKVISTSTGGQNQFEVIPNEGNLIQEFPIETITANLSRPSGPQRFITISMVFILETPQDRPTDEMTNKTPAFRDEIIDILNTQSPQDILKLEGREVLKDLLKNHLNQNLKEDKVRGILFTQFKVS